MLQLGQSTAVEVAKVTVIRSQINRECFEGIRWDGTPTGKEVVIAGLDAYVNKPVSGPVESALVLISDIFGWKANNARLYVDKLASEGYYVVLPDVLHGKALELGSFDRSTFGEWLAQFPREKVFADCLKVVEELKAKHGIKQVGVEGFCWGGLYAVLLAGTQAVSGAVVAHPSFVTKEDVEAIQQPTLFLAPANDSQFPDDFRDEVDQIMRARGLGEVVYYPHAAHGWTLRGDLSNPQTKDDVNDAYQRAVLFFAVKVPRA
eukprot:jgi/Botrbrau1/15400/Bobra.43_2s0026.1